MQRITADQYRQRAKLVRYTAEAVRSALLRQDLLDIADEYERLAEPTERDFDQPWQSIAPAAPIPYAYRYQSQIGLHLSEYDDAIQPPLIATNAAKNLLMQNEAAWGDDLCERAVGRYFDPATLWIPVGLTAIGGDPAKLLGLGEA